jgi:hypothetical protein
MGRPDDPVMLALELAARQAAARTIGLRAFPPDKASAGRVVTSE